MTLCPLLLFSTVRIHHDGLAGLFLFCGFVAFLEALTGNRLPSAIVAAVWLVAGFNLRFNSILMLPVVAALRSICGGERRRRERRRNRRRAPVPHG